MTALFFFVALMHKNNHWLRQLGLNKGAPLYYEAASVSTKTGPK